MKWLSVTDVSDQLDIPAETIRRYINRHFAHLQVKKISKSYFIADNGLDTLLKIRELYRDGKQEDEVAASLDRIGVPINMEEIQVGNELGPQLNLRLNMLASMLMSIDERLKAHEEFRSTVVEDLDVIKTNVGILKTELGTTTSNINTELDKMNATIFDSQKNLNDKLDVALSRIETYGQRKSSWLKRIWNR